VAQFSALLLGAFFLMPLFATPHFSLAGMTCAAAGAAVLARPLMVPLSGESRRQHLLWGTGLLVWGALIRWEGAALILCQALLSAIAVRLFAMRAREIVPLWPVVRAAATAAVLMGLALIVHISVYQRTPGWRGFAEFNLIRGRVTEYASNLPPSPETLSALRVRTGWSGNDLELLRTWFFDDASVFSVEKLYTAQALLAGQTTARTMPAVSSAAAAVCRLLVANWPAFCVLACVVLAGSRSVKGFAVFACHIGIIFILLLVVTATLKEAPFRVHWPMFVLMAGILPAGDAPSRLRPLGVLALLVAAAVLAMTMTQRWRADEPREALADAVAVDIAALRSTRARFVVVHGDALQWESFWRPFRRAEFGIPLIAIGASVQTPPIQRALRRQGYPDLVQGLCSADQDVLIARPFVLPKLVTFMAEHHHRNVLFEPALTGRTFTAWRCR
jgi:hypothetical protein